MRQRCCTRSSLENGCILAYYRRICVKGFSVLCQPVNAVCQDDGKAEEEEKEEETPACRGLARRAFKHVA